MHEGLKRSNLTVPIDEVKTTELTNDEESDYRWNQFLIKEESLILDLFHGQYLTVSQCPNCDHKSRVFDTN